MTDPTPPAGWATVRLDEIAEVRLGRQRSPKNHTGKQMRRYLRAANVTWNGIDTADVKEMNFTDDEVDTYRLREGDVLLSEASGSAKEVGKPGIWRGQLDGEVCFQNTLIRVRPEAGIDSDFLYYRFLHEALRGGFVESSRGVGIHHLGSAKLSALNLTLPPTAEQSRIAESVGGQLEALTGVLGALEVLGRRLAHARRSIIQRVCLGTVRPFVHASDDSPTSDHASTVSDEDLPSLPSGWHWSTLGDLADVAGGVTKDAKKQDDPAYIEVPYLRVANVQEGALKLDVVATIKVPPSKAEALRLLPGDVLMNEGGDRDKLGRGWVWDGQVPDCIHQNHVFRARIRGEVLHPKLLSWHGNTFGRSWFEANGKQTTNLASISLTNIKRLPVPVPPVDEQQRMVDFIGRHLEMLDATSAGIALLRRRCEALRRSVLAYAFAGGMDLHDETDEAADVLLKTITEARAAAAGGKQPRTARKTRTRRAPEPEETTA